MVIAKCYLGPTETEQSEGKKLTGVVRKDLWKKCHSGLAVKIDRVWKIEPE